MLPEVGFDDRPARLEQPLLLGFLHQEESDPVLDRAPGFMNSSFAIRAGLTLRHPASGGGRAVYCLSLRGYFRLGHGPFILSRLVPVHVY